MRPQPEPEVIPPGYRTSRGLDDATLNWLATLLDDGFRIPGTEVRFGLDPVVGLLPGFGDLITGTASFLIVFAAWQRGVRRVTIARMVTNIAIDTLLGSVPILGDMFDIAWKSNRMNINLLQRTSRSVSRQDWRDWLFFVGLILAMVILIGLPLAMVWLAAHFLRGQ